MEYLLFVTYLILFAWLLTRIRFFTSSGLTRPQLVIIFLLKVIAGIFYGWVGHYYGGTAEMLDTWSFHQQGLHEYQLLYSNPHEYFTNLFHNGYTHGRFNFFASYDSYWNDLKTNIFIKILSIFDVLSFGHFYVNGIFYIFITLFGPIALFKVLDHALPGRRALLLLSILFIPSFFYWSSGIHKEGLIFLGIALLTYHVYFALQERRLAFKRIIGMVVGAMILFLLRNFVLVIMMPPIIAWIIATRYPKRALASFVAVYLFFGVLFFTLRYISPQLDFPQAVVDKQQAFMMIKGNSSIPIKQLEPNPISFLINSPQAIMLSCGRPYPGDIKHILSMAAAIELGLILLLFPVFLFFRRKEPERRTHIGYFLVFFSFTLLLSIGFSVNNLGAIVRYRSIVIPLLVPLMLALTDWRRIIRMLRESIK